MPPPRPRADGIDWDVFISYRSVNRPWAIALHDMLIEVRYAVFLDQFVLASGKSLIGQLGNHIDKSRHGFVPTWPPVYSMPFTRMRLQTHRSTPHSRACGRSLRRLERTEEATQVLELLRAEGHNDPETLGMPGAAWADIWEKRLSGKLNGRPADALEARATSTEMPFNSRRRIAMSAPTPQLSPR